MLALLLAVALIGLTVLSLLLAGAIVAAATAIAVLNLSLLALRLRVARMSDGDTAARGRRVGERWRPSAFRAPPAAPLEAPFESDDAPRVRIYRG